MGEIQDGQVSAGGVSELNADGHLYDVLQVGHQADAAVIEAAYRVLRGKLTSYGDMIPSDIEQAQRLAEAYRTLIDPEARRAYDQSLRVPDPRRVGSFKIIERLAESGNCYIYRGQHELTGTRVCVKHCFLLDRKAQDQLVQESRILAQLKHFCLPVWHDFVRMSNGTHAIIMSHVPGLTIEQLVQRVGAIPPKHVGWIVERLLNTLLYLGNAHGVIHTDLNPKTVIVHGGNTHLATPVGFSHAIHMGEKPSCRNDLYSSPEQLAGEELDATSDLYGLGWLAVYMCTGSADAVKRRDIPESIPPHMRRFIQRLTEKDFSQRASWTDETGTMIENLCDTWSRVRRSDMGAAHTKFEPMSGIDWTKVR